MIPMLVIRASASRSATSMAVSRDARGGGKQQAICLSVEHQKRASKSLESPDTAENQPEPQMAVAAQPFHRG